jgi:glycosyltransferase involved in cell wall biosynthesis
MRVAVDARTIYSPRRRGTGKNLIDLYTTLAAIRPQWEFVMLHHSEAPANELFAELPNVRPRRIDIRGDRFNLWQDVRLPFAAATAKASLLHCPANTAPLIAITPIVVTIHDLNPLETAPGTAAARAWERRVRSAARHARHVITPSEYSRRAIAGRFGIPADRITVNYWAPDRRAAPAAPDAIAAVRRRYGIPEGFAYLLAFGAEDPRKNTDGLLRSWAKLPVSVRERARLLIVGLQPEALERYGPMVRQHVPDGSCLLSGFAPEDDISPLMSGAEGLCYPSRAEGFGLPLVDAFACGTAVMTSTKTSLPEIAGDAALLVDPDDDEAIANGMRELLTSPSVRIRLREAGTRRLALFSWEHCARTVADVFTRTVAGKP